MKSQGITGSRPKDFQCTADEGKVRVSLQCREGITLSTSTQATPVEGKRFAGKGTGRRQRKTWLLTGLSEGLPTLPGYVFELNGLLSSTPVDMDQVGRVVRTDPSLTAQIFRLSNMTGKNLAPVGASLEKALTQVGTERLRTLVMTTSLLEYTGKKLAVSDVQAFWQHCFLTALLSERIAQFIGFEDPEKAYFAGLLHDIGTLSLLVFSGSDEYGQAQVTAEGSESALLTEREQFGLDHCEMGRWIGVSWKFPMEMIEVFEYHHDPGRAIQNPQLVGIVAAADSLCELRGIGIAGIPPRLSDAGPAQYREILGRCLPELSPEDQARVSDGLQSSFLELFQMLEFTSSGTFGGVYPRNSD